jgi:hypothetical protein
MAGKDGVAELLSSNKGACDELSCLSNRTTISDAVGHAVLPSAASV